MPPSRSSWSRRPLIVAGLTLATLAAGGCGGDSPDAPAQATEPRAPAESGGPRAVADALQAPDASRIRVRGSLVARGDDVRLCEVMLESYPPQCGGASLRVRGADLREIGVERARGVAWAYGAEVEGVLRSGVLTAGRGG